MSFSSFAVGLLQLSLVVLDDELPYSLGPGLLLTSSPIDRFQAHVLDPITMDDVAYFLEIREAEVKHSSILEDREAK